MTLKAVIRAIAAKLCDMGRRLLLVTNRKWHTLFQIK